jgi:regulator of replication initiation timing
MTAYEDANRQLQAKIREVEQDRPSMKAQMEIVQLRKENQTLQTENSSLRGKVSDLEASYGSPSGSDYP